MFTFRIQYFIKEGHIRSTDWYERRDLQFFLKCCEEAALAGTDFKVQFK